MVVILEEFHEVGVVGRKNEALSRVVGMRLARRGVTGGKKAQTEYGEDKLAGGR